MSNVSVVVLIIAHKSDLENLEIVSLQQCYKVLGNHPIRVVCPKGLKVDSYRDAVPNVEFDFINPKWQKNYRRFNRFKIHPFLYKRYREYDFMLTYELDAFVFKDELEDWCTRGYDYIGAPFWLGDEADKQTSNASVGNGGFSLRRIESMLRVTNSFRWVESPVHVARKFFLKKRQWPLGAIWFLLNSTILNNTFSLFNTWQRHEDVFWGVMVSPLFSWFRVAPPEEAARFSFEEEPRQLYADNNGELPFGCHAWHKIDFDFWQPFIKKAGYSIGTNDLISKEHVYIEKS